MKKILIALLTGLFITGCSNDENEEPKQPARRTVMVYMAGENNLSYYLQNDIDEMIEGVKTISKWDNLIVFVDRASKTEPPFIIRLTDNDTQPADTLKKYGNDFLTSDPAKMKEVLTWIMTNYPADDYGLVLWGHANGWVIMNDSVATNRAIAVDNGKNSYENNKYWLNIPTLRQVLQELPHSLKFIFADCCNMQNIEVAYELKDATKYLIASPAGIPGTGAPYKEIIPDLFIYDDIRMCTKTCDDYYAKLDNENGHLPMAAIQTSAMPQLAEATNKILSSIYQSDTPINVDGLIYYYMYGNTSDEHVMYDINDFLLRHANEAEYEKWVSVFNQAIVHKCMSTQWEVQGGLDYDFEVTDKRFGGVSMLIPLKRYETTYLNYNELIKKMGWYYAVGWADLGW